MGHRLALLWAQRRMTHSWAATFSQKASLTASWYRRSLRGKRTPDDEEAHRDANGRFSPNWSSSALATCGA